MATAVLDDRGRVVLPREVVEELGVARGDQVIFEKRGSDFVVTKGAAKRAELEAVMDWDPKRTGKPARTTPRDMKEIWNP